MSIFLFVLMFVALGFVFYVLLDSDEVSIANPDVVRLFRSDPRGVVEAYHAAWLDTTKGTIVEHFGKVGTYGETVSHSRKFRMTDIEQIEDMLATSRNNYFSEIAAEDFFRLTVQFKFEASSNVAKKQALVMRARMRHAIDDVLSWTGLGKATKEKYQKDTMKILFDVTDFEMASAAITKILNEMPVPEYEIVRNRKRRNHSSKT